MNRLRKNKLRKPHLKRPKILNVHMLRFYVGHKIHSHYKRGFGVHSPFVYDLVRHVITTREVDKPLRTAMRQLRHALKADRTPLAFTDFGTGKDRTRLVSEIARSAAISEKYGLLLARIVKAYKPQSIIEVGTSLGVSTAYMAMAAPTTPITTIEGCPACADYARRNFAKHHLNNIEVLCARFDDVLPQVLKQHGAHLVYIDGNHTEDATLRYFDLCCQVAQPGDILIFDDIHWSSGMTRAWQRICDDPRIKTSVDLFRLGLVFFRTGCPKQHYRIRW